MGLAIKKELLENILRLSNSGQDQALGYIKALLEDQEMEQRTLASEQDIEKGKVKSIKKFKSDFEAWKKQKR
ncbi:MAG: hypothetical protein WD334_08545, partial [Chitinophagales bacterium]